MKYLVIYLGQDGREYGFSRRKTITSSTPRGAIEKLVTSEYTAIMNPCNRRERADLDYNIEETMSTYTKAGGGVYVAYDGAGTYIATRID